MSIWPRLKLETQINRRALDLLIEEAEKLHAVKDGIDEAFNVAFAWDRSPQVRAYKRAVRDVLREHQCPTPPQTEKRSDSHYSAKEGLS